MRKHEEATPKTTPGRQQHTPGGGTGVGSRRLSVLRPQLALSTAHLVCAWQTHTRATCCYSSRDLNCLPRGPALHPCTPPPQTPYSPGAAATPQLFVQRRGLFADVGSSADGASPAGAQDDRIKVRGWAQAGWLGRTGGPGREGCGHCRADAAPPPPSSLHPPSRRWWRASGPRGRAARPRSHHACSTRAPTR